MNTTLPVLRNGLLSSLTLITPILLFLVVFFSCYFLRRYILNKLLVSRKNVKQKLFSAVKETIENPSYLWVIALSLYVSLSFSTLSDKFTQWADIAFFILITTSVTMVAFSLSQRIIQIYSKRIDAVIPVSSLTEIIVKIVLFILAALFILNKLGISIAPILTTLGIGGLAVALALQDTLANLFAGFHILMTQQVRIGDYVKLESGQEGYITDISWRTTKIRMLPNNIVLVPNTKLSQAIITNYYLPEREMSVAVDLGVHYQSDLNKVEQITIEVAKEVQREVPGAVNEFVPSLRFHTFGDFSINFSVSLRGREFTDQYLLKHEFIKRLHERYNKENIVIPYPIRTLISEK